LGVVPGQWQTYAYLMQLYTDMDSLPRAEEIARNAPRSVDVEMGWIAIATGLWQNNKDKARAYQILNGILERNPNHENAYQQLLRIYYQDKQYDSLENLLGRWASNHPNDTDVQEALAEVRRLKSTDTLRTGVRVRQVDVPRDTQ
ncbi:MAG: tetratricopeptide repeat protein, partial [candidate division Zixibacteria bacterium]|nr:tetratricopeptide repeat protein [candidate division Zixibacteria bacterium]